MDILFDIRATQPNVTGKRHGGGKYGETIFFRMIDRHIDFCCFYDSRIWLNPEVSDACTKNNIPLIDVSTTSLEEIVFTYKIKLVYSPLPEQLGDFHACKVLGTQHGLRLIETPFDFFLRYHYRNIRKPMQLLADIKDELNDTKRKIYRQFFQARLNKENYYYITDSVHSKYSLLSQIPSLNEEDVRVYYCPTSIIERPISKENKYGKYFLMVSGGRADKNNLRGVIALDRLFSQGMLGDCKVIVTGLKKNNKHLKLKHLLGIDYDMGRYHVVNKDRFIFLDYVSEEELSNLYAHAYCFLFPSLNEGFGYPPLEAMHYGVPVLCSAISSLTEVYAQSVIYFAPFSIEEIMNRCLMITNPTIYEEYHKKSVDYYAYMSKLQENALNGIVDYMSELAKK